MRYNVVFVGSVAVGKTSIIKRYLANNFATKHVSTIAVDFIPITIDKTMLSLWDTCGQERFMSITSSYYMRGHIFVLVHDTTEPDIERNLKFWYREIQKKKPGRHNPVIIVVSNKMDQGKAAPAVRKWCRENLFEHVETSAKLGTGISELFQKIHDAVVVHHNDWLTSPSLPFLPLTPTEPSPGCNC
jgi:small GTP-binding protein